MPPNNLPQGMPFGPNGPNFGPNMGPQGMGPGMPNGGPEAWARQQFVPNPERPQGLQNTIGGFGGGEMGMRLRQALASNEVSKVQMDRWTREPWLAYPFLNSVISTNDPMMQQLGRWYLAARVGRSPEEQRAMAVRWEQSEPQSAAMIRGLVNSVYGGLSQSMNTQMATNQELRQLREGSSTNVLEGFGTKFADYMRDWRDHPVTAAGVVVGFYMLFKAVKNRNIGAVLGIGAVGVALYSFFRDQYGIEPIESIAKATDKWGLPTASNIIRKTLDTVRRPFQPAEVEGSAFSYLGDQKLGINGDDEKRMLGVIWGMKPADFLAAHQAVLNQSMGSPDGRVQLPPAAREILRRMGADQTLARKWNNYTERQRAEIFLKVSSKIVAAMPGGMRFGSKFISDRYVTGAFFQESFGSQGGKLATARGVNPVQQQIAGDMQYAVQHADMKMGDVMVTTLMTPEDWQKIQGYKHGYSAMQMANGIGDTGRSVLGWVQNTAGTAWDVVGKETGDFWSNNVMPFMRRNGITQDAAEGILGQAKIALGQARNSVIGFKNFVVGSTMYRVTKEGLLYVWDPGVKAWKQMWSDLDKWSNRREVVRTAPPPPLNPLDPIPAPPLNPLNPPPPLNPL